MARYFSARLGPDQMLVQDAVQNLFLKIIDKPFLFDPNRRFSTWIFTMAMNMCKNEYRLRRVRNDSFALRESEQSIESFAAEFSIDDRLDNIALHDDINRRLEKMDAAKRDTFLFRFQQQLSLKEISEIMACSVGTVKSRLFYTIRMLAEQLQEYNPNERS